MSYTVINDYSVTLHNISTQFTQKSMSILIRKHFPNLHFKVNLGFPICKYFAFRTFVFSLLEYDSMLIDKNGTEIYRVYIKLTKLEDVNQMMRNRSNLQWNGEQLSVTRTLPKSCPLYDRCVTGVKISIHQSVDNDGSPAKLNECDLRKHFQQFGRIRYCKWTNDNQTEALFAFAE